MHHRLSPGQRPLPAMAQYMTPHDGTMKSTRFRVLDGQE
jgi:hypothetical protein